ncbi:hypothetical protein BLA29_010450, partial [Euroglyphus maynei]
TIWLVVIHHACQNRISQECKLWRYQLLTHSLTGRHYHHLCLWATWPYCFILLTEKLVSCTLYTVAARVILEQNRTEPNRTEPNGTE